MSILRYLIYLTLSLSSHTLSGQLFNNGQSIEFQIFGGRLIRHTPKIIFDIKEPSYGFILSLGSTNRWIKKLA